MELMNDSERTNKNKNKIVGGLQILKFKNSLVYFDIGEPPKKIIREVINLDLCLLSIT